MTGLPDLLLPRPDIDEQELAADRLANLRRTMAVDGLDLVVLTNPVSIRYATGYRGYTSFQSRIPSAYTIIPLEGPIVMHGAYIDGLPLVDVSRRSHAVTTFDAGLDPSTAAARFASDVRVAACELGYDATATIGIERTTPTGHRALDTGGLTVVDAEPTVEAARSRKSALELDAMAHAIAVAQCGMARMHAALRPGLTENQLFSILHHTNIANDGDWIDGRMLCSGPRTNPWYQEASGRTIQAGELVAFDTDMIGPYGYCADISRTWVCGAEPTAAQRDLHRRALDEIEHNMALLHVGASFAELSHQTFRHPPEFVANRYACAFHGVGMSDEYPKIPYPQDWEWTGYDGELHDGVVLSVESYVGADGDVQGVKLEQMVQVTSSGIVALSTAPTSLTFDS